MAHFTVIGLGRFGIAASLELIHLGHTVTGVDSNPKLAEKYVEHLSETVVCDSTDEAALKELDLASSQAVLVAIGEDMQSSILCTLALKNLAVKQIWVKASTKAHHTPQRHPRPGGNGRGRAHGGDGPAGPQPARAPRGRGRRIAVRAPSAPFAEERHLRKRGTQTPKIGFECIADGQKVFSLI